MNTIDNIMAIVDGIDQYESDGGWWETSAGVQFGRGVKQALRAAIEQSLKDVALSAEHGTPVEPVATVTVNKSMGAEFKFNRPHTLLPGEVLYVYTAPQPKQEPAIIHREIVRIEPDGTETWRETPLYTAPQPQREWVGLTDEDEDVGLPEPALWGHGDRVYTLAEAMKAGVHMDAAGIFSAQQMIELAQAVEARLREKNGGRLK